MVGTARYNYLKNISNSVNHITEIFCYVILISERLGKLFKGRLYAYSLAGNNLE